jgi:hypothetical protein
MGVDVRRSLAVATSLAIALTLPFFALGCVADTPNAKGPSRPLPTYEGHSTELFDDAIEAGAVGLEREQTLSPRGDALLRERTKQADAVIRVSVDTVTERREDSGTSYQVDFRTLQKLAGSFPPDAEFSVHVERSAPSAGVLKAFEGRLVKKTFVAFVRLFARGDGDTELHFHLAPDSREEIAAVSEARDLASVN